MITDVQELGDLWIPRLSKEYPTILNISLAHSYSFIQDFPVKPLAPYSSRFCSLWFGAFPKFKKKKKKHTIEKVKKFLTGNEMRKICKDKLVSTFLFSDFLLSMLSTWNGEMQWGRWSLKRTLQSVLKSRRHNRISVWGSNRSTLRMTKMLLLFLLVVNY